LGEVNAFKTGTINQTGELLQRTSSEEAFVHAILFSVILSFCDESQEPKCSD